jgi:hypothetical protein
MTTISTLSYVESYQEKSSLSPKNFFSFFAATMAWSGFGPYHSLCCEDTPTKGIGIIHTPWTKTHALGLDVLAPQPEL